MNRLRGTGERFRQAAAPYFVLLLSLLASLAAWQYVAAVVDAQNRARFDELVRVTQDAVVGRMETYTNALRDAAAYFAASDVVTRLEWRHYVNAVNIRGRYPGIDGMGFARRVAHADKIGFIQRVREDRSIDALGHPGFAIQPDSDSAEYVVVDYIEPFSLNVRLFGQNLATDPALVAAVERARDTGVPAATAPVSFVGEGGEMDFLIFIPTYARDALLTSEAARRDALQGFVFARFKTPNLLRGIFGDRKDPSIDFEVFDGDVLTAEHLVFDNDEVLRAVGEAPSAFARKSVLGIAGRTWTLYFTALPGFELASARYFPLFVLTSGIIVSLLLFGVTLTIAAGRAHAERGRAALKESEQRFKSLVENSTDLIWAYYFDGRPAVASRSCCGRTPEELASGGFAAFLQLHVPTSRELLRRAADTVRETGERAINLAVDAIGENGNRQTFLANLAPVFDADGNVVGVQGISHDITELKSTQRALRDSETRFWDIIETAHDLVWSVDQDGRWVYLNQATRTIYGHEPSDLLGRPVLGVTHPDRIELDRAALQRVLAGDEITQHETVHLHRDGAPRYLSFNIKPRLDENRTIIGAMGTARDVTEQKRYERALAHLTEHDPLTGLYNRHHFQTELERRMADRERYPRPFGVFYIDVDNFKYVNDTHGHAAGDQLLLELAQLQIRRIRNGDILARFGGDEFTVLLQGVDADKIRQAADAFRDLFEGYTFAHGDEVFDIRVSVGAALVDDAADSASEVLAQADLACALAKGRGRNQVHIYDADDLSRADMASDIGWSRKINHALEHDDFVLLYQPIVRVCDGAVDHYEALLRMRDGDDLILPTAFLPAAERCGLIHAIDRSVVDQAIRRLATLHRQGRALRFSINLSGRAFQDPELLGQIRGALTANRLDPSALTFEITETAAIAHMADAREFIEQLRALGCRFALDDFGSGFSSYSYLKLLPVDYVKIDGSFVQHLGFDRVDQAMVQSMNQVAHALGKQTIAEFVEDEATLVLLKAYGVDYAQGHYLGAPTADLR